MTDESTPEDAPNPEGRSTPKTPSRETRTPSIMGLDRARIAYFCAPTIIFIAPLVNFLQYHEYQLTRPEAWVAGALIATCTLILGALMALRPQTLGHVFLIASIALSLDLAIARYGFDALVPNEQIPWGLAVGHWAFLIALFAVAILLRRHISIIALVVFGAFGLTSIVLPPQPLTNGVVLERPTASENSGGPIVHILFDEFIGVEGIPTDIAGGRQLRDELKRFFRDNGFTLYGAAFSHMSETKHSVAAMLNGQIYPTPETAFSLIDGQWQLARNAWFTKLAASGYALQVYDNSWLRYCREEISAIELCQLFPANSVGQLQDLNMPVRDKAEVILSAFLESAPITNASRRLTAWQKLRLGALTTGDVLQDIAARLAKNGRGKMVFAHLLSPHYSYILDEQCRIRARADAWNNRSLLVREEADVTNTPESRAQRYQEYFKQAGCTLRLLSAFMIELREAGLYESATIIVQGDHGSRIALRDPDEAMKDKLTERDLLDHYSTLYAVKEPGTEATYDRSPRSIQALFAETFLGQSIDQERNVVGLRQMDQNLDAANAIWLPFPDFGS